MLTRLLIAGVLLSLAALGGCTTSPDAPAEWRGNDYGGFNATSEEDAEFWRKETNDLVFDRL